jgi:hypothetical protein
MEALFVNVKDDPLNQFNVNLLENAFLKVWWPYATLFVFIFLSFNTFIHHSFINIR